MIIYFPLASDDVILGVIGNPLKLRKKKFGYSERQHSLRISNSIVDMLVKIHHENTTELTQHKILD